MNTRININNGYLNQVTLSDSAFIHALFTDKDVKTYYVLRADHAANIDAFIRYMIDSMEQQAALDYIIYNSIGQKVGLITAELIRLQNTGEVLWNVGYAVAPQFRNRGYATTALDGLTNYLLTNFSIQKSSLDICTSNADSERVAAKCGYKKPNQPGQRIGYIDPEHMELGMRFKWFKSLGGKRAELFNRAASFFRMKDYNSAVKCYQQALDEPYQQRTPFTDAQIYSNMGMAYSSIRQYQQAFTCLKKAQAMGLTNPSIERELLWLRNNVGLY